jgi:hypothetical protein
MQLTEAKVAIATFTVLFGLGTGTFAILDRGPSGGDSKQVQVRRSTGADDETAEDAPTSTTTTTVPAPTPTTTGATQPPQVSTPAKPAPKPAPTPPPPPPPPPAPACNPLPLLPCF